MVRQSGGHARALFRLRSPLHPPARRVDQDRADIVRLICEHLEFEGLHSSRIALEREFSECYGATSFLGSFLSPPLDSSRALSRQSRLAGLLGGVNMLLLTPAAASADGNVDGTKVALEQTGVPDVLFTADRSAVEWGTVGGLVAHMVDLARRGDAHAFGLFADIFFTMLESFATTSEACDALNAVRTTGSTESAIVMHIAELWLRQHFSKLPTASQSAGLPSVRALVAALEADGAASAEGLLDALAALESSSGGDRSQDAPPWIEFPLSAPRAEVRVGGRAKKKPPFAAGARAGQCPAEPLLAAWPQSELQELALQWTAIEYEMFAAIPRYEFMGTAWTWKRYTHAADRVRQAIAHFDAVSEWVMSEVLRDDLAGAGSRAKVVAAFIRTAGFLLQQCNFQGAYEIVSALDRKAIKQLEQTWRLVPVEFVDHLQGILAVFDLADNKRNYRSALQRAVQQRRAIVPQLSLHFGDLVMLEDETGQPNCHPERAMLHNWAKWTAVYAKVAELLRFQERPYQIAVDDGTANFLKLRWQRHHHIDEASSKAADKALLARSKKWVAAGH